MNRIKIFIPSLLLMSLTACESDVESVILPEFNRKLAVTAFISPSDSILNFFVSSNMRIYGELDSEEPIGNLEAYISNDSSEVALDPIDGGFKTSREKIPVRYGTTYKLKVSDNKGLSVEAFTTIPSRRNFSLRADTFSIKNPHYIPSIAPVGIPDIIYEKSTNLRLTFSDPPGEENYYRIMGIGTSYHTTAGRIWESTNPIIFEKEYLIDKGMDGKLMSISTINNIGYYYTATDSAVLKIYLYNLEESYYLYHKSLNNYNDNENPFAEATPIFSNVRGGLGVFTSYTVDSLIIRLK